MPLHGILCLDFGIKLKSMPPHLNSIGTTCLGHPPAACSHINDGWNQIPPNVNKNKTPCHWYVRLVKQLEGALWALSLSRRTKWSTSENWIWCIFCPSANSLQVVSKLAQILHSWKPPMPLYCVLPGTQNLDKRPSPHSFKVAAHAPTAPLLALLRITEMCHPACSVSFWDTDRPPAIRECRTSLKWFYTTDSDMDDCRRTGRAIKK